MGSAIASRANALPGLAEVFRKHGYDGATITLISNATGLGKGSLYNFFPGGKSEMLTAVLLDIDNWFTETIFDPLEQAVEPWPAIVKMFDAVTRYFDSGERVCIVGALGMGASRDPFAETVAGYFLRWISALTKCLCAGGRMKSDAAMISEDTVAGIQGAIILSRALNDRSTFKRVTLLHCDRIGVFLEIDATATQSPAR